MPTSSRAPRSQQSRPPLPTPANPKFKEVEANIPAVKYQIITREGQDICVGRLKVLTPSGHAFILRRFDTNGISLTTMFRAAFPDSSDEDERLESQWVKSNYDLTGANGNATGSQKLRLAGTWVTPSVALSVAPAYGLSRILVPLLDATPGPIHQYRKSTASNKASPAGAPASVPAPTTQDTPSAPKRRRGASPTVMSPATLPTVSNNLPVRSSPRIKSKSPPPNPSPLATRVVRQSRRAVGSDDTMVDLEKEEEFEVPGPDMHEDIADQQALISQLKAQRAASKNSLVTPQTSRKRGEAELETPPLKFDFDKAPEVGERQIVLRQRVMRLMDLQPRQKAAAWGALAFTVGAGAAFVIPGLLFSSF